MSTDKPTAEVYPEPVHWPQHAHERMVTTRHHRIAVAAYLKAEARGFEPGHEANDWLVAQLEPLLED